MTTTPHRQASAPPAWLRAEDAHLHDLLTVIAKGIDPAAYPQASRVEQNVLVYDAAVLEAAGAESSARRQLQAELMAALSDGPGIVVVEGAIAPDVVDRVTTAFESMIGAQRASGVAAGDHFAKPGANDRVWNALEKLAVTDPGAFVDYYASDVIALVCTAWLGPGYQVTSQVNVVNPGGEGQTVHRDYHLGFQSPDSSAAYPAHVHALSPVLTLQGAVAHCDMPVVSGPTLYLPHSHKYSHGYLAYWLKEFQDYFLQHHIQLPLAKGDAVFFNPALFHAAGSNHSSDIRRMANLLQVSSAFGRAMETVDRERVSLAVYPSLLERQASGWAEQALANVVASSSEGYAFPTNLDRDPPLGGMAPPSQAQVVSRALDEHVTIDVLAARLAARTTARESH